jgi:hypothetical protein
VKETKREDRAGYSLAQVRRMVVRATREEREACIEDAKAESRDCGCADKIIARIKERGKA